MEVLRNPVVGDGGFSIFPLKREVGHHFAVFSRASDIGFDGAFRRFRHTPGNRLVDFNHLALGKLAGKAVERNRIFCNDDKARGVLVEPVHNARAEG